MLLAWLRREALALTRVGLAGLAGRRMLLLLRMMLVLVRVLVRMSSLARMMRQVSPSRPSLLVTRLTMRQPRRVRRPSSAPAVGHIPLPRMYRRPWLPSILLPSSAPAAGDERLREGVQLARCPGSLLHPRMLTRSRSRMPR